MTVATMIWTHPPLSNSPARIAGTHHFMCNRQKSPASTQPLTVDSDSSALFFVTLLWKENEAR